MADLEHLPTHAADLEHLPTGRAGSGLDQFVCCGAFMGDELRTVELRSSITEEEAPQVQCSRCGWWFPLRGISCPRCGGFFYGEPFRFSDLLEPHQREDAEPAAWSVMTLALLMLTAAVLLSLASRM